MNNGHDKADEATISVRVARQDDGSSFVEILVAIVLLGTVVIGLLTAVRATVLGTRLEEDHSGAHQWLQSASEVIRAVEPSGCAVDPLSPGPSTAAADYQAAVDDPLKNLRPPGWDGALTVSDPVKWWDEPARAYVLQPSEVDCSEGRLQIQLIELTVTNAEGDIVERVEVVKRV